MSLARVDEFGGLLLFTAYRIPLASSLQRAAQGWRLSTTDPVDQLSQDRWYIYRVEFGQG